MWVEVEAPDDGFTIRKWKNEKGYTLVIRETLKDGVFELCMDERGGSSICAKGSLEKVVKKAIEYDVPF